MRFMKARSGGLHSCSPDCLDRILTSRFLALPVLAVVVYLIFACAFSRNFLFIKGFLSPGVGMTEIVEYIWVMLSGRLLRFVGDAGASELIMGFAKSSLDGIGAVVSFLPSLLVLFLLLSFLEDSGYMARAAFVTDRPLSCLGLSGHSLVPLLMGVGYSIPFMPSGAKSGWTAVMEIMCLLGVGIALMGAWLLNRFAFRSEFPCFVLELPQYRIPSWREVLQHGWKKTRGFAVTAGTVIWAAHVFTGMSGEAAYPGWMFHLLCMPCFAEAAAIRRETGSWKRVLCAIGFQMTAAYAVSWVIPVIGSLYYAK